MTQDQILLNTELRFANQKLWRIRLLQAALAASEKATLVVASLMIPITLYCVGGTAFGWPQVGWRWWLTSLSVVGSILLLFKIVPALLNRPSIAEVTERLDIATNSHNALATAEEFLRRGSNTPFEKAAIAHGLKQLSRVAQVVPALPTQTFHFRRSVTLAAASVLLIVGAIWVPGVVGAGDVAEMHQQLAVGALSQSALADESAHRQSEQGVLNKSAPDGAARSSSSPFSGGAVLSTAQVDQAHTSATDSSVASQMAAAASAGAPPQDANSSAAATADGPPAGPGNVPSRQVLPPKQDQAAAAAPDTGADGAPRGSKAPGGTRPKPAPMRAGKGKPPEDGQPGSAKGSTPAPPGVPPPQGDGDGDGEGAETDMPLPPGTGSSKSPTHSNEASGDGRSLGESSRPKKSRGVAPLLLGTRQPDLFQARPLAGPDERTKMLLPPKPDPGVPAASVAAADRVGDERPMGSYQVPADVRGVVGAYFKQFHAQAEPSPSSAEKHD